MQIETGVSYFANRWTHHFATDLEEMQRSGVSYVVHTLTENDLIHARETMRTFFSMTRDAGLGVWADPWAVMGLFGGEAFSAFIPRNPQASQVLTTGQRAPAACPSAAETRVAMKLWIDVAADLGADTLFWDEPHFYIPDWDDTGYAPAGAWACRCMRCLDSFQRVFGRPMPDEMTPDVLAHRQGTLLDFLGEMTAYGRQKGMKNAVCLLPVADDDPNNLPWEKTILLPGVDIFGTDPYWRIFDRDAEEFVREQARRVVDLCRTYGREPHIWVQAFGFPEGSESEVVTALETAASEGAVWLAAWGYRANECFNRGGNAHPEHVWENIGKTYRKLRGSEA